MKVKTLFLQSINPFILNFLDRCQHIGLRFQPPPYRAGHAASVLKRAMTWICSCGTTLPRAPTIDFIWRNKTAAASGIPVRFPPSAPHDHRLSIDEFLEPECGAEPEPSMVWLFGYLTAIVTSQITDKKTVGFKLWMEDEDTHTESLIKVCLLDDSYFMPNYWLSDLCSL